MPPAGDETLARWREVGEWWSGQPQRVVHRYIDKDEIRREVVEPPPPDPPEPKDDPKLSIIPHGNRVRADKVASANSPAARSDLSDYQLKPKQPYAVLHTLSGHAFGRSTMFASVIPGLVANRDGAAVLLADPYSLSGAFEFQRTADEAGMKPLIGATFELAEGGEIVLVARNKKGFRSLSRLITDCHLEEPRQFPLCNWERLERHATDLLCLTGGDDGPLNAALVRNDIGTATKLLDRFIGLYGRENVFIEIERTDLPWQIKVNRALLELADEMHVVPVAGGPVTHAKRDQFPAQDMLVCIETLCLIEEIDGRKPHRHPSQPQISRPPRRGLNAERKLRTYEETQDRYSDRPDLIENTMRVAERCEPRVLPDRTQLPAFCSDEPAALREIAQAGARKRYPVMSLEVQDRLDMELDRLIRKGFASNFLIAWDMCNWARAQGIVLSGRGSVVDSLVAYCLGISRIDTIKHNLLFDRFLPEEGSTRPDIDIDFEARRRDDVRGYLTTKYGDKHVATVAAIGTYRTRGIVREVGKVMGIPPESLAYLTKRLHGSVSARRLEQEIELKPELRDSGIPRERFRWVFQLGQELANLPRGIRSHSSGVVISRDPIADTVPVMYSGVEDVKIIQWDKRSAKYCFDKFDVLCLRGNDVLSDTQRRTRMQNPDFNVEDVSLEDENTYRAMRSGQLIGVPQSASPAMRQAHIRIQTKNFADAGIVQAAIRPGVGGTVKYNEFIARRKGKDFTYSHDDLREILEHTYGIVVFQEQIDGLLKTFGGYCGEDAEIIREGVQKYHDEEHVEEIHRDVIARIESHGYASEVAEEVYELVAGFKGYGFAQGHALAFADISIRSIWCQQNYPSEYFAALLDAQPAGYYGPCTLANEARSRGVKMLPPDINFSELKFSVEDAFSGENPRIIVPNGGIRVSLNQISGISKELRERIVAKRARSPYSSFFDAIARIRPHRDELEKLIMCGAFDRFERNRRVLLWAIPSALEHAELIAATRDALPLSLNEPPLLKGIEPFSEIQEALDERTILALDVEKHLLAFERSRISAKGGVTAAVASNLPDKSQAFVVGNPIRLRFPPTSSGKRVMFFDLEDETGLLNVTCFDDTYQRYGQTVICSPYVTLWGTAQNRDGHIAFLAHRIIPFKPIVSQAIPPDRPLPIATADFLMT